MENGIYSRHRLAELDQARDECSGRKDMGKGQRETGQAGCSGGGSVSE